MVGFCRDIFSDVSGEIHHDAIQFEPKAIVVVICGGYVDVTNLQSVGVIDGLLCCNRNADAVVIADDDAPEIDVSQYMYTLRIDKASNLSEI